MSNEDEKYMRRALQLAKLGAPNVSPNPMVGAVVVCDGKIIGEGYHRKFGNAHAEVNAINSVRDQTMLKRSTLYVTLEPCSHYGKTPPCAEMIINKGIPKVVIGSLDPFKLVRGRGVKMLEQAGIEVYHSVLEEECRRLNYKFITAHSEGRPYVILKWAITADGFMGGRKDHETTQVFISNPVTQMLNHKERGRFDAIMVGAHTVVCDNPSLTQRYYVGDNPLRVILSSESKLDSSAKVFNNDARSILFTRNRDVTYPNAETIILREDMDLVTDMLNNLYKRNVTSLIVEGGAKVLEAFIHSGVWDEIRVEQGTNCIGNGIRPPHFNGVLTNVEKHGENLISRFVRS